MKLFVGSINPRACDAQVLAHIMRAFADIEGVFVDVLQDAETNDLLAYFVHVDAPIVDAVDELSASELAEIAAKWRRANGVERSDDAEYAGTGGEQ
jgi:hypothetical protein